MSKSTKGPYCWPPKTSESSRLPDIVGLGMEILIEFAARKYSITISLISQLYNLDIRAGFIAPEPVTRSKSATFSNIISKVSINGPAFLLLISFAIFDSFITVK